ncbi:MAG TPA: hypothetical protein VFS21_06135 [Roseiflexaceae bacterium]|nr:hypothetical protein [Roseiflexaceae bacterium]
MQRDIIIFPPLGSQSNGQRLNLRQACEELAEAGHGGIVFQAVVEMVQENWFGHSRAAFVNTARLRSQGMQGPTIDDTFAMMVQQQANRLTTGQVQEVQDQNLQKYIKDNKVADLNMDSPDVIQGKAIATTGLATCVAVGFTATHGQHRYNAIYHWSGVESPAGVFAAFRAAFDEADDSMPQFSQLQDVTYYVVGGSRDSVLSQLQLLEYMGQMGLNVSAITLRNSPQEKEMSKAVVILPNGTAVYSVEDQ